MFFVVWRLLLLPTRTKRSRNFAKWMKYDETSIYNEYCLEHPSWFVPKRKQICQGNLLVMLESHVWIQEKETACACAKVWHRTIASSVSMRCLPTMSWTRSWIMWKISLKHLDEVGALHGTDIKLWPCISLAALCEPIHITQFATESLPDKTEKSRTALASFWNLDEFWRFVRSKWFRLLSVHEGPCNILHERGPKRPVEELQ